MSWMPTEPKHHIAVVDDEPDLRSSVAEYLQLQGYTVSQAGDGPQLRAILAGQPIDLVLLDLRMPGEDGLTVLRGVREHFGVPVIMVTAMGDPIDRIVGLEVGADDYVVKPFEFRELLARIRSVDIRVARLRKKVERDPAKPEAIRTVRGTGYMFVPDGSG